jgi:hypothetical protein
VKTVRIKKTGRMERMARIERLKRVERMEPRVQEKGFIGHSAGAFSRGVLPPCQRPSNRTIAAFLARFDLYEDKHNNAESIVATGAQTPRHLG